MMENEQTKNYVLVVDDSDIIRHALKHFFNDYNLEVITSLDGLDGIQQAVKYKPVLIFLDIMMPNFDGVKMLQVIKVMDSLNNIPVIVISGNTNRTNVLASIEAGADKVISKPLKKEVIIKNVNELLGPDFLKNAKKSNKFSFTKNKEIKKQLCGFFLKSFPQKKNLLVKGLKYYNKEAVKNVAHEIRGSGSAIGYPRLTVICGLIEDKISSANVDWTDINELCEEVFSIVDNIEKSNTVVKE